MDCPKCGKSVINTNRVIECRVIENSQSIRRRRQCKCGYRFSTREFRNVDLEELLLLRRLFSPNGDGNEAISYIDASIEDLKTGIFNLRKMKGLLEKSQGTQKTILYGINGGKHDS